MGTFFETQCREGHVLLLDMTIFPPGAYEGCSALQCKFGPPHISETIRARKLKFCTHLDKAKYSVPA